MRVAFMFDGHHGMTWECSRAAARACEAAGVETFASAGYCGSGSSRKTSTEVFATAL